MQRALKRMIKLTWKRFAIPKAKQRIMQMTPVLRVHVRTLSKTWLKPSSQAR